LIGACCRLREFAKYAQRLIVPEAQQIVDAEDDGSDESEASIEDLDVINNEDEDSEEEETITRHYVHPVVNSMTFGKHKGRTMSWVLKSNVSYTHWCMDTAAKHGKHGNFSCAG
jgi:hypothetical protein